MSKAPITVLPGDLVTLWDSLESSYHGRKVYLAVGRKHWTMAPGASLVIMLFPSFVWINERDLRKVVP